jgi:acyl-[acyl-carrier-protein] desaturase
MTTRDTAGRHAEVLRDLEPVVATLMAQHAAKASDWLPSACLPRSYREDDAAALNAMRRGARAIPIEARVCLALNLVTEEGLPLFHRAVGEYLYPDAHFREWLHQWTAEEDRHGHVLRDYVALTGLLEEVALDRMTSAFIRNGWEPGWDGDPYRVFVYTSLQERATQIAHRNTARLIAPHEPTLAEVLGRVVQDEARHYAFYRSVLGAVLERDPDGALAAANEIMPLMAMPGGSMPQYKELAEVAAKAEVYSLTDYEDIVAELLRFWRIDECRPESPEGCRQQEALLAIPARLRRLSDRMRANRRRKAFRFDVAFAEEFEL